MAKKKGLYGISNYVKKTHTKRKRLRKKYGPRVNKPKKYKGQGR